MDNERLANVAIGDKLFISGGPHERGSIATVDRITPTGRVITQLGEFNIDGRQRGGSSWYKRYARVATDDDIAGVNRYLLVQRLANFRLWQKLNAADLKTVAELIAKYDGSTP